MDISLSLPSDDDADEFLAAVAASRALHRPWIEPPDTPDRFADYLERATGGDRASFLVRHAESGALVGYVNINNIVRGAFQSGYLGYAAFGAYAGRGLMTQGLGAVLDLAFGDLGLHRVEANIQPANRRSLGLVQRLGFEKEGTSPRYLMVDGDWRDHERWALRSDTWRRPF
ncbi:MAG TPA: GNAT family N-acetyltransferase [Acidimicrobiales bacterium]|jgi:ribosomal-protein-alanine N-acetyltransferase|nr:GNAT family N-acetyltransferase [Acidimicrobiales bacterium]